MRSQSGHRKRWSSPGFPDIREGACSSFDLSRNFWGDVNLSNHARRLGAQFHGDARVKRSNALLQ